MNSSTSFSRLPPTPLQRIALLLFIFIYYIFFCYCNVVNASDYNANFDLCLQQRKFDKLLNLGQFLVTTKIFLKSFAYQKYYERLINQY